MTDSIAVAVESPPESTPRRREQSTDAKPKVQPPYAVVVFNEDLHSFQYVIETFTKVSAIRRRRATRWPSRSTPQAEASSGPVLSKWRS